MKKEARILEFVALIVLIIVLSILFWKPFTRLFSNLDDIRDFILDFGALAPIIFILFGALQTLISPLPGQLAGLASGYIFGAFAGTIYSMLGVVIGSSIAFFIGRRYGRPIVEKFVDERKLRKADRIIHKGGRYIIFLIFLLPGLPDDIACYAAGLTSIKIRTLVVIAAIGRFPGFLMLNLAGAGVASGNSKIFWIFFAVMVLGALIVYIYRNKIEKEAIEICQEPWNEF